MNLIVSRNHRLANRKYIKPLELVDENYITYSMQSGYGVTFNEVFEKNGLFPRKITKVQLTEAIIEMVKSNLGVAVMAGWAIQPHLNSGELIKIKIGKGGMKRKWYAATLKFKKRPCYIDDFISTIIKCKN